jgi:anaerobic selenocysteine-containing dehydrogenase
VDAVGVDGTSDASSFRLVSPRRLYDGGVVVGACSSLAGLAPPAVLRSHPEDLDRVGARPGQRVRARTAHGALVLEAVADDGVPKGTVSIPFNLVVGGPPAEDNGHRGAASNVSASLIGAGDAVVEVTLEVVEVAP